jgi:hypothetical protein
VVIKIIAIFAIRKYNKDMSLKVTRLSKEEIIKIATNYVLCVSSGQVLKITKWLINEHGVALVNVRCISKIGERFTIEVIVTDDVVSGLGGFYRKTEELLVLEPINPDYGFVDAKTSKLKISPEELAANKLKQQQEKEAEKKKKAFDDFVKDIQGNVDYALDPKKIIRWGYSKASSVRAGAKRSIKRHSVEKLESIIELLDEKAQKFVQECIDEIMQKADTAQAMVDILSRKKEFSPAVESVLDQIELSVEKFENAIYTKALEWFAIDPNGRVLSKEQLEKEAKDYVDNQKARLMYAAVRYLGDLDITSLDNSSIRNHHNGFEGIWKLTLADGTRKTFRTHTIIAEGHVQRAHYRYIVNLS